MAQVSISPENQQRIAEAVKDFMQDNLIEGEVNLDFTENFTVEDNGGGTECCTKMIGGRKVVQCPCQ